MHSSVIRIFDRQGHVYLNTIISYHSRYLLLEVTLKLSHNQSNKQMSDDNNDDTTPHSNNNASSNDNSTNDDVDASAAPILLSSPEEEEQEEARLEYELQVIRRMNQAFSSSLCLLTAARDDLVEMGRRMDRLRHASQQCRRALVEKQGMSA